MKKKSLLQCGSREQKLLQIRVFLESGSLLASCATGGPPKTLYPGSILHPWHRAILHITDCLHTALNMEVTEPASGTWMYYRICIQWLSWASVHSYESCSVAHEAKMERVPGSTKTRIRRCCAALLPHHWAQGTHALVSLLLRVDPAASSLSLR